VSRAADASLPGSVAQENPSVATELAVDTADAVRVYLFGAGCLLVGNCSGVGPIDGSRSGCPLRIRNGNVAFAAAT